jgi:poly-gamma-glutamate synthesis protein (capsule biosynthesis protein)
MSLLLLGDIVSCKNSKFNINADASLLLFNLETPIIKEGYLPSKKAGPNLSSEELVLPVVNSGSTTVANLANNHIMDYGHKGLKDTLTECGKKKVLVIGAGENLEKARLPIIIEVDSKKIGIIGCCETQFGISTPWKPGVASLGPWLYSTIKNIKYEVDIIIISIHGASEMSLWPSTEWQELLRSFIDAGSDIVHGHHSHVPQGFEEYNDGLIFYGLGNFVVDPKIWKDQHTLWSIVPEINVANEKLKYQINTSVISEDDNSIFVRKGTAEEFEKHKKYLEICNKPLNDKKLLTALWQEVSVRMYYLHYAKYMNFPEGNREWQKLSIRKRVKSFLVGMREGIKGKRHFLAKSTQDELLLWYHLFACESHKDSIATALGVLGGELEDLRSEDTKILVDEMMPEFKGDVI